MLIHFQNVDSGERIILKEGDSIENCRIVSVGMIGIVWIENGKSKRFLKLGDKIGQWELVRLEREWGV